MSELQPPEVAGYVRPPRTLRRAPGRGVPEADAPHFSEQMATFVVEGGQPLSGTISYPRVDAPLALAAQDTAGNLSARVPVRVR